jgi:excisionase family DNA binding protein
MPDRRTDNPGHRDGALDQELLDRFLDVFADRLAAGLLERVERRAEEIAAERGGQGGAVSVEEAARRLGISPRGVARLMASGELPSLRVGRRRLVPSGALERLIARGSGA